MPPYAWTMNEKGAIAKFLATVFRCLQNLSITLIEMFLAQNVEDLKDLCAINHL